MQVKLHRRYDLRSRKRSRIPYQNDEPTQPFTIKHNNEGKNIVSPDQATKRETSYLSNSKTKSPNMGHMPTRTQKVQQENKEVVEEMKEYINFSAFNLQKELEKVKIYLP